MAMITCPECGKEFSDRAPACPNCGCPVQRDGELTNPPEPQKVEISKISVNKSIKKIALLAIAVIVVIAVVFGVVSAIKSSNAKKAAATTLEEYASNLSLIRTTMLSGAAEAEQAGGLIHDVWYNTIYEKSDSKTNIYTKNKYGSYNNDFNVSLRALFSDTTFQTTIDSINKNQDEVSQFLKELINPPEEYKEAYSVLKDLYDAYTDLCKCAVDPSGNLSSYTSTFNEADGNFMKYYNALELYIK